ncbi:MAG: hypothetical protein K0S47_2301 [Herbinix sp.]|jgi:GNAT superfamily N-acetyltransferase|nr:hypothetical protein [Herbinix sp.]
MLIEDFNRLKEGAKCFLYHSFEYVDYDDVKDYKILQEDEKLILLYSVIPKNGYKKIYWAANGVKELGQAIASLGKNIVFTFIPLDFRNDLIQQGFTDYAMFREYWIEDINSIEGDGDYKFLKEEESEQAAKVTQSCRLQSRGFLGEQESFFREWISNQEPGAVNCGCKNCCVLIHKIEQKIVGVACVAVYGQDSKKGPVLWLREIAVMPEYQGKGLGRKLIRQAIQYGKENGAKRAFLMADDCNHNAIRLYESIGFVPNDDIEINMMS